jgi:hypothetical protein
MLEDLEQVIVHSPQPKIRLKIPSQNTSHCTYYIDACFTNISRVQVCTYTYTHTHIHVQLKVLAAGFRIKVITVPLSGPDVNVPEDIKKVEEWLHRYGDD